MTDPSFNLLQLEQRPNWYDHLHSAEAAMEALRKTQLREQAEGLATDSPTVYVALTTNYQP